MRGVDGETTERTRVPYLIISHDDVAAEAFEKSVGSLPDGGSGCRDTVKNLGRHLYSTELAGLEAMIVRGNPMVARVMHSPQVDVPEGECAAPAFGASQTVRIRNLDENELWAETRCGNGRGERAFR